MGYADHAGGLDQVATVLAELAERIDAGQLPTAAATAPLHWAQRLGYLLALVGAATAAADLKGYVRETARDYAPTGDGHHAPEEHAHGDDRATRPAAGEPRHF